MEKNLLERRTIFRFAIPEKKKTKTKTKEKKNVEQQKIKKKTTIYFLLLRRTRLEFAWTNGWSIFSESVLTEPSSDRLYT